MKNILYTLLTATAIFTASCANGQTKDISPEEFNQLSHKKNSVLIDVRTPEEFKDGHLNTAKNINLYAADFEEQIKKIDKTQTVLVYCAVGGRSAKAAKILEKNGFKTLYNLSGGYNAWKAKSLKTSN